MCVIGSTGLAAPVANYYIAWLALGRMPRPSLDDPKFIPGIGWVHTLSAFAANCAAIPCTIMGFVIGLHITLRLHARQSLSGRMFRVALPVLLFAFSVAVLLTAPGSLVEWFLD